MPDPAEEKLGRQGVLSARVDPPLVVVDAVTRAATRTEQCQVLDLRRHVAGQVLAQQLRQSN